MMTKEQLLTVASKCDALCDEMRMVTGLKTKLEDQVRALLAQLGDVPTEKLILPQSPEDHFSPENQKKIEELAQLRAKIDTLPAAYAQRERKLKPFIEQIGPEMRNLQLEYEHLARERVTSLYTAILAQADKVCSGDRRHWMKSVKDMIPWFTASKWIGAFSNYAPRGYGVEAVRDLFRLVEQFERDESHVLPAPTTNAAVAPPGPGPSPVDSAPPPAPSAAASSPAAPITPAVKTSGKPPAARKPSAALGTL